MVSRLVSAPVARRLCSHPQRPKLEGTLAMTSSPFKPESEDYAEVWRFAAHYGLEHEHNRRDLAHHWDTYPFGLGNWRRVRNVVRGTLHGRSITAFEYHYVLLSDNSTERDAFRNFLVCVVDLDHPVPALTAVLRDREVWHEGELQGTEFPVNHEAWNDRYLLVGDDDDFARAVVTEEHAARCAEIDAKVEWRFAGDDFLLWMESVRVGEGLSAALAVLLPLITTAENFPPQASAAM
jgi:hypothetical protein